MFQRKCTGVWQTQESESPYLAQKHKTVLFGGLRKKWKKTPSRAMGLTAVFFVLTKRLFSPELGNGDKPIRGFLQGSILDVYRP